MCASSDTQQHDLERLRKSETICIDREVEAPHLEQYGHPRSWPRAKKLTVVAVVCFYTFVVYIGSTLCLAMYPDFERRYNVTASGAGLAMALYVIGYGAGALFFAPISDIDSIGRNPPYQISFALFVLTSLALATVDSWVATLSLRFFQGFFGSPALATGGASLSDLYDRPEVPFALIAWIAAATCGPAFGPTISVYGVYAYGSQFPLWLLFGLSLPCFVLLVAVLPETSMAKILYIRAESSAHARIHSRTRLTAILKQGLDYTGRPLAIMLTNPVILFANFYVCVVYAVYYSFFESFPRIYLIGYGFSYKEFSLTFMSISLGAILGVVIYVPWAFWWRRVSKISPREAESCLAPGVLGSVLTSAGLLLFALTAKPAHHWPIALSGVMIETAGVFLVLQALGNYVLLAYPRDAASLLAGGDFTRALLAGGAIMFSSPLYDRLGVQSGVIILTGVTGLCILGMVALFLGGHRFRPK